MDLKRWVFIFSLLSFYTSGSLHAENLPISKQGVIDLSQVNFIEQTSIPLAGDWEFQWNEFTSPLSNDIDAFTSNQIQKPRQNHSTNYLAIGKRWKEIHSGVGFATYQLRIIFPEGSNQQIFSIRFYQTGGAAMRVFVDGKDSLSLGKVGTDKLTMEPTRRSGILILPHPKKVTNILVHISNFHHDDGSFWYAPKIGLYQDIQNNLIKEIALDSLLSGALFFMAFYHFVLFFFRRTRKLILYFGLFCLTTAFHSLSLNGDVLYYIYRTIPYHFAFALSLIFYLAMPFYLYFLFQLFPNQFSKRVINIYSTISFVLYSFVLLAPTEIGSKTTFIGLVFTNLGLLYSTICLTRSAIKKQQLAVSLFLIQLFLLLSAINDTLYLYGIFHQTLILKYSYLTTVLFQSLLLASYFTKMFIKNETLKNELATLNESLEKTIIVRTKEYKEAKQIAEDANQWKDKFISLVAHDLRSPLSTVYSALTLTTDKETTEDDKTHILNQVFAILENAMSTIEHLLNLNRFQIDKGQIHLQITQITVNDHLKQVVDTFTFEIQKKSLSIVNLIADSAKVFADSSIFLEILRNLIANAIKFSHPKGKIQMDFLETNDSFIISIKDEGTGIPIERQKDLFIEPMSSPGTLGEKGFGIGLKLCFELMRLHHGNIQVESESNSGSRFLLIFPKK